jgi:Tfp pilus assembly protein PilF
MIRIHRGAIVLVAALSLAVAAQGRALRGTQAKPQQQTEDNPGEDAFRAAKAVEIGEFYMKKGDEDAAIERFKEAIQWKPNFARPRLLLAKAYEKKSEKAEALKYYEEYLKILPKAEDAARVRKRIEKLKRELQKESSK